MTVRCSSCECRLGFTPAKGPLRNAVYCSALCAEEPPRVKHEIRNAEWEMLASMGIPVLEIARRYDMAHTGVYLVLNKDRA